MDESITYIGDGVYANFDGYQVYIWTSDGIESSEPIAFDDNTAESLIMYFKKCWGGK